MKRLLIALAILGLAVALAGPGFCDEPEEEYEQCYDCPWGAGGMMGPGYGWHGGRMMRRHHPGWGMHEGGPGWDRSHRGWRSMKPEEREKWEKMRSDYQQATLELRKQLVTKQMELETLWAQPDVDPAKVKKLSDEVAQVEAELGKKRNEYLLQCRKEFGGQDWACPGGW